MTTADEPDHDGPASSDTDREPAVSAGAWRGDDPVDAPSLAEPARADGSADAVGDEPLGDEQPVDDLVGDLFRDVDDRFNKLERDYQVARTDLSPEASSTATEPAARNEGDDPIAASAARFELVQEIATLRADVERQAVELDERDRMLGELSERLIDFETRHRAAEQAADAAESLRQQLHDDRRELTRVQSLLEASLVERQELSMVAQRLQAENDDLDNRLSAAADRFDEAERSRASLADGVAQLEAARKVESEEFSSRQGELQDAKNEARRLADLVDDLTAGRDEAVARADRIEHDVERRANEISYLNRRIDALTERASESDVLDAQVKALTEERALLKRRIGDLEREVEAKAAEVEASARAIDALAERGAYNEALQVRVRELEAAADTNGGMTAAPDVATSEASAVPSELQELADRARALGAQRGSESYRPLGIENLPPPPPDPSVAGSPEPVAADLRHLPPPPADLAEPALPATPGIPQIEVPQGVTLPPVLAPTLPDADAPIDPALLAPPDGAAPIAPPMIGLPTAAAPSVSVNEPGERRRIVLPADMHPDTPEAVEYLLSQQRLTAIVDARSVCASSGVRPSQLFSRLEALRDRFDLPIEVVVTPVSTPVGGAPTSAGIGVHHVTGADTVSDRVRALCIGFPADEQLVVIAADDHVRRAAIGKEANVVDPTVALDLV